MKLQFLKRLLSLLMVTFLIINFVHPAFAEKGKSRTVTVAYPIQDGLTDIDENGNYTGYTYEYLEEVAQYTGWNYEYIQIDEGGDVNASLVKLLDMVASGEIDIIGSCYFMDELAERYNYTAQSYGSASTALQVLYNDPNPPIIDSQVMQTIKIAVPTKSGRIIEELEEFCEANLIKPIYVYCSGATEQLAVLKAGEAEAILNSSLAFIEGVKTIASFANKPIYFMGSKNAEDTIIRDLGSAISTINFSSPYLQTELFEKYFSPKIKNFAPTEEESDFITEGNAIRVGYCPTFEPLHGYDEKKQPQGIAIDTIRLIGEIAGIKYEFIPFEGVTQIFDACEKGEVDVVSIVPYDYKVARERNISLSRSFFSAPYAMLVNDKNATGTSMAGKRKAIVPPYNNIHLSEDNGAVPVEFESVAACMNAVKDGNADFTYVDTYTAYFFADNNKGKVRVLPSGDLPYSFCFGLSKLADRRIITLMNKAITIIGKEDMQEIIRVNTTPQSKYSVSEIIANNPTLSIGTISGILLLVIAFMSYAIFSHKKTNKSISFEIKKHDRIYQLLNDYFFEYDYKKEELIISLPNKNEGEPPEILKRDCKNPAERERNKNFLDTIRAARAGIIELQVDFYDERSHWVRLALQTICDDYDIPMYIIGKINIIDDEVAERAEILRKVERDGLTHAFNSESCRKKISKAIVSLPLDRVGALIFVDIDFFKEVNDTYGHMCGDELLKRLAELFEKRFAQEDIVGRLGGDEFMMYSESIDTKEKLAVLCERLCDDVRKMEYKEIKNVTLSIGASIVSAIDSFDDCYKRVDDALYKAKGDGRNCYRIAEDIT